MTAFKAFFVLAVLVVLSVSNVSAQSADPPTSADCTDDTPFADTENCTCYYQCFMIDTGWYLVHLDCPPGGIWDDTSKACIEGTCAVTTTAPTTEITTTLATTTISAETTGASSLSTTAGTGTTQSGPTTGSSATEGSSAIPSQETTPTTIATSGAPPPPPTFECTAVGLFPHPTDPTKYYQCVLIGAQFYYYIYTCAPNSCFQSSAGMCVAGTCPGGGVTTPSTTTSAATATTTSPVDIVCNTHGSFPFPGSCTKYYQCILIQDSFVYYVFECPPNSHFDPSDSLCVTGPCPSDSSTTSIATTTTGSTTTTAPSTTSTLPEPNHPCPSQGYFPDPDDCQAYYQCILVNGYMYRYMYRCPAGAYWNSAYQGCIIGACPTVIEDILEDNTTTTVATTTTTRTTPTTPTTTTTATTTTTTTTTPTTTTTTTPTTTTTTTPTTTTTTKAATTTTAKASTTTAASTTTTTPPVTTIICTTSGLFPLPTDCTSYYQCVQMNGRWYFYTYTCPPFSRFDPASGRCIVGTC